MEDSTKPLGLAGAQLAVFANMQNVGQGASGPCVDYGRELRSWAIQMLLPYCLGDAARCAAESKILIRYLETGE